MAFIVKDLSYLKPYFKPLYANHKIKNLMRDNKLQISFYISVFCEMKSEKGNKFNLSWQPWATRYLKDWLYFVFLSQGGQGKQACSVADRLRDIFEKIIDSVNDTRESRLCEIHSARRL
jgi:hypothetical protein